MVTRYTLSAYMAGYAAAPAAVKQVIRNAEALHNRGCNHAHKTNGKLGTRLLLEANESWNRLALLVCRQHWDAILK